MQEIPNECQIANNNINPHSIHIQKTSYQKDVLALCELEPRVSESYYKRIDHYWRDVGSIKTDFGTKNFCSFLNTS